MTDEDGKEPVGSVGEEAAKLLSALQDWAKESGTDYAGAFAGAASGAAGVWKDVNEHVATGAEECRYCPICRVVAAVRQTSPEVRDHLASAASSLMQAAAGMMATHVADNARNRRADTGVEKIDLADDGDWEDD